ncbi:MAG: hypothetical protein N4A72_11580 [Bacteroidales bacterium]|jgi:hypothetical protein|nr:hypothetical protein [Bacteroidales bacterium]
MNKRIIYISLITLTLFVLSSCVATYDKSGFRGNDLSPNDVQLIQTMDDYLFIDQVDIEVHYTTYLGFIREVHSINNHLPTDKLIGKVNTIGGTKIGVNGLMKRALYDIIITYPDASFFVVVNKRKSYKKMFLSREVKKTMTIRLYKQKK